MHTPSWASASDSAPFSPGTRTPSLPKCPPSLRAPCRGALLPRSGLAISFPLTSCHTSLSLPGGLEKRSDFELLVPEAGTGWEVPGNWGQGWGPPASRGVSVRGKWVQLGTSPSILHSLGLTPSLLASLCPACKSLRRVSALHLTPPPCRGGWGPSDSPAPCGTHSNLGLYLQCEGGKH